MTREEYKSIYDVVGAAQEVHTALGRGLAEPIYQEALAIEMRDRGMVFEKDYRSQLFNYMRIAHQDRGVLLNFCEKSLPAER